MNNIIIYLGICLSILSGILYIRNHEYRYWLILLYLLLLIYGFYNINKQISLGGLLAFIICYLFIAKKPEFKNVEHYKDHTTDDNENKDDAEENFKSSDQKDTDSVDEKDNNSVEQKEVENNAEHLEEKGIEQFGLSDKFSQLHNLIHQMEKHNKLK
jgi:hypothetical protein